MMRSLLLLTVWLPGLASQAAELVPELTLYAPAACQPCADWAQHLRHSGIAVVVVDKEPHAMRKIKRWLNVPSAHEATHTARVAGYFVEGPVPAQDVHRLLARRPLARGLVTGLPTGEPATQGPVTLLVGTDGGLSRFAPD